MSYESLQRDESFMSCELMSPRIDHDSLHEHHAEARFTNNFPVVCVCLESFPGVFAFPENVGGRFTQEFWSYMNLQNLYPATMVTFQSQ